MPSRLLAALNILSNLQFPLAHASPLTTTLYLNPNTHTIDPARPRAQAIAVSPDGRILAGEVVYDPARERPW